MSPDQQTRLATLRADRLAFEAATIDDMIDAMRSMLDELHPHTGSEALRALREAFPQAPLAARVEAMQRRLVG